MATTDFQFTIDPKDAVESTGVKGVFEGTIVAAEVKLSEPRQLESSDPSKAEATKPSWQIELTINSPKYEKAQRWWLPFANEDGSAIKGIGSKWMNFVQMLHSTGAMKDVNQSGNSGKERMENIARSLIGMQFTFEEIGNYPFGVNILDFFEGRRIGQVPKSKQKERVVDRMMVPVKYLGRVAVQSGGYSNTKVNQYG